MDDTDTRLIIVGGFAEYFTGCAFPRGGIAIIGVAGAEQTTIDVGATTPGLVATIMVANQVGAGDILIEGFTINGAISLTADPLVVLEADKVTVQSCRFVENISVFEGRNMDVEMVDCDISQNQTTEASLISVLEGRVVLERCRFRNNIGRCVQIDSEYVGAPVPHIQVKNCEFTDNRSEGYGTCLDLYYANIVVSGNLFLRNVAEKDPVAGLRASECFGNVEFNVFAYDSSYGASGAWWDHSNGYFRNNTFVGCHGTHTPSAFLSTGSWIGFENNIVTHSTGRAAIEDRGSIVYGSRAICSGRMPRGITSPVAAFPYGPVRRSHLLWL